MLKLTSLLFLASTSVVSANWLTSTNSVADEVTETGVLGASKQATGDIVVDATCLPDTAAGDKPCEEGCGWGTVPNPYNPNAAQAELQQRPAPCKNYACICADSGCLRSWTVECVAWYVQCQENQICGAMPSAAAAVTIESSCAIAPTSANTPLCYESTIIEETPTPAPEGDDDDGKGGKKGSSSGKGGKKGSSSGKGDGKGDDGKGGKKGSSSGKGGKKGGDDDDDGKGGKKGSSGKGGKKGGDDDDDGKGGKKGSYDGKGAGKGGH